MFIAIVGNRSSYLELTETQLTKLKQLSIVTLVQTTKVGNITTPFFNIIFRILISHIFCMRCIQVISYVLLIRETGISDIRQLEDLVIDSMYSVCIYNMHIYVVYIAIANPFYIMYSIFIREMRIYVHSLCVIYYTLYI